MSRRRSIDFTLPVVLLLAGCNTTQPVAVQEVFARGAVAADQPLASDAGAEMLQLGGNAVDAAVAASFCLSVVDPFSCGIGGGGFMIVHDPATSSSWALNYRETAPASVGPTTYVELDDPLASRFGAWAIGTPGTVRGLLDAHERWGTLDRSTVMAPAIRHAEAGFAVNGAYIRAVNWVRSQRENHPEVRECSEWVWTHLCLGGEIKAGDRITQPEQGRTLRMIADKGASVFYEGEIATAISETIDRHGGHMTREDLAAYQPTLAKPLVTRGIFGRWTMLSMPPPSSGGIAMQQVFRILEHRLPDVHDLRPDSPGYVHLVSEAMKHAFADRATWLADGTQVAVPTDRLLDRAYLEGRANSINMEQTGETTSYGSAQPPPDDSGTSHISIVDENGMAVACTETMNLSFGSLVAVPAYGIVLNNELDDFTTIPGKPNAFGLQQSEGNLPAPGKRPLSSMSPTIILEDGRVRIVAGASGGPRIITGTLQVILNCLLFDMTPVEAVAMARFHHQWLPDTLQFEDSWTNEGLIEELELKGHVTGRRASVGVVQIIEVTPGGLRPASDPRKGGRPAGH